MPQENSPSASRIEEETTAGPPNLHGLPVRIWTRWTPNARRLFNQMYAELQNQTDHVPPGAPPIEVRSWDTIRWNASWSAAHRLTRIERGWRSEEEPVDLIVDLWTVANGDFGRFIRETGIRFERVEHQPIADQVMLYGCTFVPNPLPIGFRLRSAS